MYHDNPAINDTMLTVINDGNGEMCGYSYEARKEAAQLGQRWAFRYMAREYSRYRNRVFKSPHLTRQEWVEAGDRIFDYYREHIIECAS